MLNPIAAAFLTEFKDALVGLHFSDKYMGVKGTSLQEQMAAQTADPSALPPQTQVLCMQLNVNVATEPGRVLKIVKAMCAFIDGVGRAKLAPAAKLTAEREWTTYVESLTKEDPRTREKRAHDARFKKMKVEKGKYEAMDPSNPARVKWEKQQEKKRLKNRQKSGMKMMR